MARAKVVLQNEFPYSLNARSNNREWFDLPIEKTWRIYRERIRETHERYGFETHAFLLMSNHFHWLVSTPNSNLSAGMQHFMTRTSHDIARAAGRINRIYGGRYRPTRVGSAIYYANSFRYIYQNPVRAKMCERVEDYPWSTLHRPSEIEVTRCSRFDEYIPRGPKTLSLWLNQLPPDDYQQLLKKALRRADFEFPRHPTRKCLIRGDEYL